MNVVYFSRKSQPGFNSIEGFFENIQNNLPDKVNFSNYYVKYQSKGFFKRLYNCCEVIFHQGDINHITGDIHYVAGFLSGKKTVLTICDIGPILKGQWLKRKLIKLFWFTIPIKRVSAVTTISEFTKNEILKHLSVDPSKIIPIHVCVSPLINYTPKPFNAVKPVLLQVGTKQNKNLPNLIKAIHGIHCKLIIVGKITPEQEKILKEHSVEYENHVNVDFGMIIELYKQADIITFLSTYEGFGMPIIEANATGRPVITSNVASMPEVAGDAAIFANPYDVGEIRQGIIQLINSPELREKLIDKGLKNAERFRADVLARKYHEVYKKILL